MKKQQKFDELISIMGNCDKCLNLTKNNKKEVIDCSLINIFKNKEMCKNIPSIWTDWYNRLDSKIFIIGQDWGPESDMKKFYNKYIDLSDKIKNKRQTWKQIIEEEKSNTKKLLTKYIIESAKINEYLINNDFMYNIYITNGIMCARQGNSYRNTTNFKVKECTLNCSKYLKSQIDIVQPKVILTLGYYPLLSLSKIFDFNIKNNLTNTIKETPEIFINDLVIIPLYHPVAQIKAEEQLAQYNRIWSKL